MNPRRLVVITNTVHTVGSLVCYIMDQSVHFLVLLPSLFRRRQRCCGHSCFANGDLVLVNFLSFLKMAWPTCLWPADALADTAVFARRQ